MNTQAMIDRAKQIMEWRNTGGLANAFFGRLNGTWQAVVDNDDMGEVGCILREYDDGRQRITFEYGTWGVISRAKAERILAGENWRDVV